MFTVRTTQPHTGHGQTHGIGDVYEVEEFGEVENLRALKFAELVEAPQSAAPQPKGETSVSPMTTKDTK
jgi:hypothetical protein